jgi:O-antigen ligase
MSSTAKDRPSIRFWMLTAFLVFVFLTGGSQRADTSSLVFLRPAAALMIGFGLWTIRWPDIKKHRAIFGIIAACAAILLLQLMPLPPSIWQTLPGRDIVSEIERAASIAPQWRPISLTPVLTANSLFSLLVPTACLIHAAQLSWEDRYRLLWVLLAVGMVSGLMGLIQIVGSANSPLYLYRITNDGSAVGLFANRNHHAVFLACIFPMLAVNASAGSKTPESQMISLWASAAAALILIPLILVTGSRAGLILGILSLAFAGLVFKGSADRSSTLKRPGGQRMFYLAGAAAAAGLGLLMIVFARAEAFDRLMAPDQTDDLRFKMWGPIAQAVADYLPIGSGAGSFVETYQIAEPNTLLLTRYVNHAHNDVLDIALTSGVAGIAILLLSLLAWAVATFRVWFCVSEASRHKKLGRAASVILLLLALSSLVDYPLRTPSLAAFAVLAAVWLSSASSQPSRADKKDKKMDRSSLDYRLAGVS